MSSKNNDIGIRDNHGVKGTPHDIPANAISNKMTIRLMLVVGLIVGIMIVLMFSVIADRAEDNIMAEVQHQAEVSFEHNTIARQWNAQYGGMYVEKTEGVVSNPYLKDLGIEPDIVSIDNKTYTLKNPALMTRELATIAKNSEILDFHLTSLNFVNPDNAPDEFEKEALMSFEKGTTEAFTIITRNGSMVYQYIAPFYIKEGCLNCHKGYNVGDIRGGISIFVPMDEAYNAIQTTKKNLFIISIFLIIGVELLIYFLVAKPIYDLRVGAMKIGGGDLKHRIPVRSNDEIGLLGNTFNKMAFNMEESVQNLHESEEKYRTLFNNSSDAIMLLDKDGFIDCNKAVLSVFGYDNKDDFISLPLADISPQFQLDGTNSIIASNSRIKDAFEKGHVNFEWIHTRKNGDYFQAEVALTTVVYLEKAVLQANVRDITERKQAAELMQLNEMRMNALVDLNQMTMTSFSEIADFVLKKIALLTNSEYGFIGLMNDGESVFTIHSWSKNAMDVCAVDDKPIDCPIENAGVWGDAVRERKVIIVNEYTDSNTHKTGLPGGHVPLSRVLSIPIFENEKIVSVAAVANKKTNYDDSDVRQITLLMDGMWKLVKRRQAEEEILILNEGLEQRVKDRTAELEEKNKELVKLDKIKSEFLDTMSHELRTPLTSIIGYSQLLLDGIQGEMTEKQADYIERILARGNHQLQLVNDVLDFSKLESNRINVLMKQVSVTAAVNGAVEDVMFSIKQKKHDILLEIADDVADIHADKLRLKQVLLNLINNAIKFTPENGKIIIKAYNVDEMVKISVIDNGIGINEDGIEKLFKKFVQVDQSNSRNFGGTGLGLAISKDLVELMGGHIDVESEYGKGSTFSIFMPQETSRKHNAAS